MIRMILKENKYENHDNTNDNNNTKNDDYGFGGHRFISYRITRTPTMLHATDAFVVYITYNLSHYHDVSDVIKTDAMLFANANYVSTIY